MAQQTTDAFLHEVINAIVANVLNVSTNHAKVHLAVAPFAPTRTSTPASFTEATFSGYAAISVTGYGTAHEDTNLQWLVNANTPTVSWTPTASTVQNDIVGYWIDDPAGNVVAAEAFGQSYPMHGVTNTLALTVGIAAAPWKYTAEVAP